MGVEAEPDITRLLGQAEGGDAGSLSAVFEALYPELRRIAMARAHAGDNTCSPTVLVHEAYLRLTAGAPLSLTSRKHFFAAAAKAMRWIVVDQARRRGAGKRGGDQVQVTLSERLAGEADDDALLALHDGLDLLDRISPRRREIVEMRYFIGLEFAEVATLLGCSESTAKREWAQARAFLHSVLADADG